VEKSDGVHMIGFDVEIEIHRVNSIVQSKRGESSICIKNALISVMWPKIIELTKQYSEDLTIWQVAQAAGTYVYVKGLKNIVDITISSIRDIATQMEA
jgi:hypothetical protein